MLAKQFRLPASVVVKAPLLFSDNTFAIKTQKNDLPLSRFGFVIGKSVDKRSTERNRIKRMVRSLIEDKWLSLPGYDVLFIFRPGSAALTREDAEKKIDLTLGK